MGQDLVQQSIIYLARKGDDIKQIDSKNQNTVSEHLFVNFWLLFFIGETSKMCKPKRSLITSTTTKF